MTQNPVSYKRHRFPPSVIAHAVSLYFRFPLSLRMVEELLLQRGIVVSYEMIRCWAMKFGPDYAGRLRQKAPSPNDVWHLDDRTELARFRVETNTMGSDRGSADKGEIRCHLNDH